ncbi:MAG: hypothetical protein IT269_10705 [Saprospiraceae bacterium]|nr:hypothetical protein [Saprospiraceae bacterium]
MFTGGMLFGELARIPAMLTHLSEHRKTDPETSVLDFVWLHYFSQHQNDMSHNHQSLPFHHHAPCSCGLAFMKDFFKSDQDFLVHCQTADEDAPSASFYYHFYFPASYVGSLFQPPRA